ncbi:MAG: VCBS repeat-containing protein, partial [Acidobacteria bacterium]|nr:VCBS repeat-containing protein [Acidobacteriota bacterium]
MRHPGSALRLLVLGCALVVLALPARSVETHRLSVEFQRLCRLHTEGEHPFFGKTEAARFRALLEGEQNLGRRGAIGWSLARALMRQGELERALEVLETAKKEQPADGEWHGHLTYMIAAVELRRGEVANCIENHTAASCILPLLSEGVHKQPEPARRAADLVESLWEQTPQDVRYRWLLNLARTLAGEHPDAVPKAARWEARDPVSSPSVERWLNIATQLDLETWGLAGGAVMDDFDGDCLLDLVSTSWGSCDSVRAWRNLGDGFEEVSESWGLAEQSGALNLVHADYDNDGDLDLFLTRGA